MNHKGVGRAVPSIRPVPRRTLAIPANSTGSPQGLQGHTPLTHSAEDIPKQYSSSLSNIPEKDQAAGSAGRVPSPVELRRGSLASHLRSTLQAAATKQPGVRYITEDLIKKVAKEDNLNLITSLNLTLVGEKKIKYIENLDRLQKLQTLNLSLNIIERIERLDKLGQLRELNLASNMLTKIEGLENLTSLQSLNINDNHIEHIPPWFAKKMKTLRTFRIARNKLATLFEVSKLKALSDITQIDIAGNPLCDIPHWRLYVVFHLRTVEVLDGKSILDQERKQAQERLAIDEVQQLEKKLEQGETKYKQLEESHNKSLQERSVQESSQTQLISKEKSLQSRLKQMEQDLTAKEEQLKKKTGLLNKASQKHYQLEQELAFYKIDSKFNTLSEVPQFSVESADDSGDIQEGPYIGRARFVANKYAQETTISGTAPTASQSHIAKPSSSGVLHVMQSSQMVGHSALDLELEKKQAEVKRTEERLKALQADLSTTEKSLLNVTIELKKISTDRITPEPFRDDNRYKIRQRLTRKMQRVNELKDSVVHMHTDIDRRQQKISVDRSEVHKMKSQLTEMGTSNPGYQKKHKEMLDKESQVTKSSQTQTELQKQLEETVTNIAKEKADIQKLEVQLSTSQIEPNEDLRYELDDIVSGLSGYLENVKGQSLQHKQDFEILVREKEGLEEKIRRMEAELHALESETSNSRQMQKKLTELEDSLRRTEELNTSLKNEVHRSQQKDPDLQNRLVRAENEAKQLRQTLVETEKKTEMEKKQIQKQLQTERERAEKMTQRIQDVNRQDLETKKLVSQLEAAKALNVGLRDQIEEFKHRHQMEDGGFKPSDLKKRLKMFIHDFKTNKNPIEPQDRNDILGMTFQDLQKHTQQQLNNSTKEVEEMKQTHEKAKEEIQTLKDKLKKMDTTSKKDQTQDIKWLEDENKQLQEEIKLLKKRLEEAKERNQKGGIPVRIVYRPDSDSGERASSLDSDEKHLYDELQRELLDLKQIMRHHENDLSNKVAEAQNEAAHWKDEMEQREKEFEAELEAYNQAAELMKEKQEARIQVIAQDLDQAQFIAESLQHMLEDRERLLQEELNSADMSNQMISAQEDELAKLYDILEAQRNEIESLNQMLDHLAQQGPDDVGAGFDDELWHIRQEVNSLKETLAMQSAYVQSMPDVGHMGSQADGFFPYADFGPQGSHRSASGAAVGTQVGGSRQYDSVPAMPKRFPGGQAINRAATPAGQMTSSTEQGSAATAGSVMMAGAAAPVTSIPKSAQSSGFAGGPQDQLVEHLGTERRESKAPPPGKSAAGKSRGGAPSQRENRIHDRAFDSNARTSQDKPSYHSGQGGAARASLPSAFEPFHRPEAFNQQQSSPPDPEVVYAPAAPVYSRGPPVSSGPVHAPLPRGPYLPYHSGPNRASQTSGVQGASRGVQVGAGQQGISSRGNYPAAPVAYTGHAAPPLSGHLPMSSYHTGTGHPAMMPGSGTPGVTFNPVPREVHNNQASAGQGMGTSAGGYAVGSQIYSPSGPAQVSHYGPGRLYVPAGAGHRGRHPARIYYPVHHSIPMPAPGGAPPPPPPGGQAQVIIPMLPMSAMTPVAAGTPIKQGVPLIANYDGSFFIVPPSPIRMDGPRGILKNLEGEQSATDDSYLFCNVPEHHDLEDYISELQEAIKKLKLHLSREKDSQEEFLFNDERKSIKKLLNELEDRRDELEGLDLAIERQKRNLRDMKFEEKDLKRDRKDALGELNYWRKKNNQKIVARRVKAEEDSFEEEIERNRQKHVRDELTCLEKTLAKRQAQLKETERNLKECKSNLMDAKEQARNTVNRYDNTTSSLHQALREQHEIEKRSNDICVELVKTSEDLVILKAEFKDIERKKSRQEKLLREINNIIAKKDYEFKNLDTKVKSTSQSLQRLHADLVVNTQREKEMVEALRDSDDILAKRRSEIQRTRDQIDQNRQDLEKLDQQIGKKRTEVQLLQETQDRKQQDLTSVLQDAEAEIASKQREIRDCRDEIEQLDHHKTELNAHIKTKRVELQKLKEEREQEEEVLQRLTNNVNKNKSELKHTLEMQNIELTELENVKGQHAQKMVELEKTQRLLLEEKSDLEQLTAEVSRKNADLERLKQTIERDRLEVDQLNAEKQNLDDQIVNLARDRNLLDENCKTMDDKLNNMKRNQRSMEEKIDSTNNRLEVLESELTIKERETEEAEIQREAVQKDVSSLKQSIKESKAELKTLHESIKDAEESISGIDQEMRNMFHQRDQAKQELSRLNEQIRQSSASCKEHSHQERVKYKELQELMRVLNEREKEQKEAKMTLNKIREEVEKEENRLNRLRSIANSDLEMVRAELSQKQDELEAMRMEFAEMQKKSEELQHNEDKVAELSRTCRDLEQSLLSRDDEKTELSKALSASFEEVQRLRQKPSLGQESMIKEPADIDNSVRQFQADFEQPKLSVKSAENKSNKVPELQSLAEKRLNRANNLAAEPSHVKKEIVTKKESNKLASGKENKALTDIRIVPGPGHTSVSPGRLFKEYDWRKDTLRERLAEERDYLRFHLQQQMLRHSHMMKSARLKSEETIDCLRWKLNNLQEVLFNTSPDVRAMQVLARARSRSGSPVYRIGLRHLEEEGEEEETICNFMVDFKLEHIANIKFCVQLKKMAMEILEMLQQVYGNEAMSRGRTRSPSPLNTSDRNNYLAQRRSRSFESLGRPMLPERDYH